MDYEPHSRQYSRPVNAEICTHIVDEKLEEALKSSWRQQDAATEATA